MIDKTKALEKGIIEFPSLYIEGAAVSGKTTAVKMLLEKHPEIEAAILFMEEELKNSTDFQEKLRRLAERMKREDKKALWVVFENFPGKLPGPDGAALVSFLEQMPSNGRAILVGRERPAEELLELLWKRRMELIPQAALLFTKEDVWRLTEETGSELKTEELYTATGGWAGCVDFILRLSCRQRRKNQETRNVWELCESYEVAGYIRREILESLSGPEQEMMHRAAICPWLNEALCREVWGISQEKELLDILERKGLLQWEPEKKQWRILPLFRKSYFHILGPKLEQWKNLWRHLGEWYKQGGYTREAVLCMKYSGDEHAYRDYMAETYSQIPFLEVPYAEVLEWKDNCARVCYLRGMYCYSVQNFQGLKCEISRLEKHKEESVQKWEIYLNLLYMDPKVSLDAWLAALEEGKKSICLYSVLGGSHTALCGLRDLSSLFACTKREENRKARIWKEFLGEEEWNYYQFARLDYYLETERKELLCKEDMDLLMQKVPGESWRLRLNKFFLLCKLQRFMPTEEGTAYAEQLEEGLLRERAAVCIGNTEGVASIYAPWRGVPEKLSRWLRYSGIESSTEPEEINYDRMYFQVRGYLLLNQYDKAESLLKRLIPYLKSYRRLRLLTELLFGQAMTDWQNGRHNQALRNTIEAFLINGACRYVSVYAGYGNRGIGVLEAYEEWMRSNAPEGWHRKKKYNYGSVLRMPEADYLDVVLRCARKETRETTALQSREKEEKLTMMETIILQDISRGLTNAEICEALHLKLPTVKSHIYSLYKKLGANSRVQAILKGKELGIVK